MKTRSTTSAAVSVALGATLILSACASPASSETQRAEPEASAEPRIALTYDGGLLVLDAQSLELEANIELPGFNRVNPAGDGRNVLVSVEKGFRVLDTGAGVAEPKLTDLVFEAPTPGHVVRHGDKTILYSDGTSDTIIYQTDDLREANELPEVEVVSAPEPHHGVSIELENGTLLTTIGDSESRSGVKALDEDRKEIARNEDCPGVHGEGAAANEISVFGCDDGVLIYDNGDFTKIDAPDSYGRTGNAYVTETSPIVIGDYKNDPDLEGYVLSAINVIDTVAKTAEVVELPAGVGYTWRDIARTEDGNALILGTDGSLHVFDIESREITESFPVIEPWESPVEWQDAHPAVTVLGGTAFVTEPATRSIHAVDVATGEISATGKLPGTPNEIAVVEG